MVYIRTAVVFNRGCLPGNADYAARPTTRHLRRTFTLRGTESNACGPHNLNTIPSVTWPQAITLLPPVHCSDPTQGHSNQCPGPACLYILCITEIHYVLRAYCPAAQLLQQY